LPGVTQQSDPAIDCARLSALLANGAATVIDLASSADYRRGHVPSAWFGIRSRLDRALAQIPLSGALSKSLCDCSAASRH
jgi:rhodanese-related sulfurtransferase